MCSKVVDVDSELSLQSLKITLLKHVEANDVPFTLTINLVIIVEEGFCHQIKIIFRNQFLTTCLSSDENIDTK